MHEDIEWVWSEGMADRDVFHGHDEFIRGWQQWLESWSEFRFELDEVHERGDSVLTVIRYHAVGRGSGLELDQPVTWVWEFRGPKVARLEMFGSLEEARRRWEA